MYYVYVLINHKGESYIGVTGDLKNRVAEHNAGASPSTKQRSWRLAYYEAYAAKSDATRREKRLKDDGRARYQLMQRISAGKTFVW